MALTPYEIPAPNIEIGVTPTPRTKRILVGHRKFEKKSLGVPLIEGEIKWYQFWELIQSERQPRGASLERTFSYEVGVEIAQTKKLSAGIGVKEAGLEATLRSELSEKITIAEKSTQTKTIMQPTQPFDYRWAYWQLLDFFSLSGRKSDALIKAGTIALAVGVSPLGALLALLPNKYNYEITVPQQIFYQENDPPLSVRKRQEYCA